MAMDTKTLKDMLQAAFPGDAIMIEDLVGDNDHYHVTITSAKFQGLSRVAQHKLVYSALGGKMGGELHAMKVTTRTP